MKKVSVFMFLCGFIVMQGCTSSNDMPDGEIGYDYTAPIEVSTSFAGVTDGAVSRGAGPVTGVGTGLDISLFSADQSSGAYLAVYDSKGGPHDAAITTESKINTGLYYLSDNAKSTKLTGVYPRVTSGEFTAATRKVTFSQIDGSTDILCSNSPTGSRNTAMGEMIFAHMLTKVTVVMVAADADAAKNWGKVTGVTIEGKKQDVVLTLPAPNSSDAPSVVGSGVTGALSVVLGNYVAANPTTTETTVGYAMFAPVTTAAKLDLKVTTTDGTFNVSTASQVYAAGKSYKLILKFTAAGIIVGNVTITPWDDVDAPVEIPV